MYISARSEVGMLVGAQCDSKGKCVWCHTPVISIGCPNRDCPGKWDTPGDNGDKCLSCGAPIRWEQWGTSDTMDAPYYIGRCSGTCVFK